MPDSAPHELIWDYNYDAEAVNYWWEVNIEKYLYWNLDLENNKDLYKEKVPLVHFTSQAVVGYLKHSEKWELFASGSYKGKEGLRYYATDNAYQLVERAISITS